MGKVGRIKVFGTEIVLNLKVYPNLVLLMFLHHSDVQH